MSWQAGARAGRAAREPQQRSKSKSGLSGGRRPEGERASRSSRGKQASEERASRSEERVHVVHAHVHVHVHAHV